MGNKITILISEFKSCHQVAKLEAESSKQTQGLKEHKHCFFSFIQSNLDLSKPRRQHCFCSKMGSYAALLAPPQRARTPSTPQLRSRSSPQPWQQHGPRTSAQVRSYELCQTPASTRKTSSCTCKEQPIYQFDHVHSGAVAG